MHGPVHIKFGKIGPARYSIPHTAVKSIVPQTFMNVNTAERHIRSCLLSGPKTRVSACFVFLNREGNLKSVYFCCGRLWCFQLEKLSK